MSTSTTWGMRGVAICAIALAAGCTKRVAVSPDAVASDGEGSTLEIKLVDGTQVELLRALSVENQLCGAPLHCNGPACARVRTDGCVAKEDIVTLRGRKVDGVTTGVVITATALVTAGLLTAALSSTPSTHTTTSSGYGGGGGGGVGGSCPRIYSWDGSAWTLDSGTFGLAYFEAAPRTDFDLLDHLRADHGAYRMRLVNEQDETEHTDLVRLRVIDHPAGTRVVPTAAGKLLTFRDEAGPTIARDLRGRDALDWVRVKDDREWSSDLRERSALREEDARDGLRLVFTKPRDAKTAKLRVAAHNTDWAGKMLGYLLGHRGTTLPAWWDTMNADARARGAWEAFLIREGMLNVRVKTPSGWSTRGMFWAAGSEIVKEEAFELEVGDLPGDTLEVELESALDFWSVDAASIAYGANEPVVVHELSPSSARTNAGRDVTAVLARADSVRFDTVRGDIAELSFPALAAPAAGVVRSFVLETRGHYVPQVTPAADADPAAMDALMERPFAASRLALAFRLATRR